MKKTTTYTLDETEFANLKWLVELFYERTNPADWPEGEQEQLSRVLRDLDEAIEHAEGGR